MTSKLTRRRMIQTTAAAGAGFFMATSLRPRRAEAANERLSVAVIGVGGQGKSNLNGVSKLADIVALCDVDDERAGDAYERFPKAAKYYDFRRLFDEMEKSIDAVVVSTPDHSHFHPATWALERGKHLYCEKPMAHSVWEVRELTRLAAAKKVATQLGVQRHTIGNMHRVFETIQQGAIGNVSEVHSWVDGERGMPAIPTDRPPIPDHLNWNLWLGPAAIRPYHSTYCPYGWRFWWDFGTGETGNWGCHILDIPFTALGLKYPTHAEGSGPPVHPQTTPKSMTTRFKFPAAGDRPEVTLHWYHAKSGPPILKEHGLSEKGNNTLFIGEKGMLLCGFSQMKLLPEKDFEGYKPEKTVADSPGFHKEWILACQGGEPATCNFDYSGPLTETVLLGNVAYRSEGGFDWDAEKLQASGNEKAGELIVPKFRKGWEAPK